MSDTTTPVETVKTEAPSNNATPAATPPVNATDTAEVERLKKEAQQAQMRANQVQNELDKMKQAQEEAQRKQLEQNEEWKSLAEQERTKREALEAEREAENRSAELKTATSEVLSQFPSEVVEIAQEAGISLTESSDEAKEALKAKLEKIRTKVVTDKPVTPNNGNPAAPEAPQAELLARMKAGDKTARQEVIGNIPAVIEMRRLAGFSEQ